MRYLRCLNCPLDCVQKMFDLVKQPMSMDGLKTWLRNYYQKQYLDGKATIDDTKTLVSRVERDAQRAIDREYVVEC